MYRSLAARLLVCPLVFLMAASGPARAQSDDASVISSGIEGGGYWSAASRLSAIANDMGFAVTVQASTGSLANLQQLTDVDSQVDLAFAQADALQFYLDGHPEVRTRIEILDTLGQECIFIITGSNSPIDSDADLQQDKGYRLGINSPDSGVAVTFNYLASQVPELQYTRVNFIDTAAAAERLNEADAGVDAIMVVHRPREHSREVALALQDPARYRFVEMRDKQLGRELPGGHRVYQAMTLAMPGPTADEKVAVKTLCVSGLLLANREKMPPARREQVHELVNQHWARVFTTR